MNTLAHGEYYTCEIKMEESEFSRNNVDAIIAMNLESLLLSYDHSATPTKNPKPCPFSVWAWQAHILPVVENRSFYTSGLMATTSDRKLSTDSNVEFVKQKA